MHRCTKMLAMETAGKRGRGWEAAQPPSEDQSGRITNKQRHFSQNVPEACARRGARGLCTEKLISFPRQPWEEGPGLGLAVR